MNKTSKIVLVFSVCIAGAIGIFISTPVLKAEDTTNQALVNDDSKQPVAIETKSGDIFIVYIIRETEEEFFVQNLNDSIEGPVARSEIINIQKPTERKKGNFYPLTQISNITLEKVFTAKVLAMLMEEKLITNDMARKILSWRYSGFSVHTKVRIDRDDKEGLQGLAQYIIRCPIAEDKILFSPDGHTVIYKSAIEPGIKKNFEVYNVLEFLAALTSHIPQAGRKLVVYPVRRSGRLRPRPTSNGVYYGYYLQAVRGKGRKNDTHYNRSITGQVEDDDRILRYRWSQLIKMVYADPLICLNCGGKMRIINFIKKKMVIERILKHLGLLDKPSPCAQGLGKLPHAHSPPSADLPESHIIYEPFFDDLPLTEQVELSQTAK